MSDQERESLTAWHRSPPELPCPVCTSSWLRFRADGMTAACLTCSRIFGAFELARIINARLIARRQRIEEGSER